MAPKPLSLTTRLSCLSRHTELLWGVLGEILWPQASTSVNGISRGIQRDFPRLGTFCDIPWTGLPRSRRAKYFEMKVTEQRPQNDDSQLRPTGKLLLAHTMWFCVFFLIRTLLIKSRFLASLGKKKKSEYPACQLATIPTPLFLLILSLTASEFGTLLSFHLGHLLPMWKIAKQVLKASLCREMAKKRVPLLRLQSTLPPPGLLC